MEICIKYNEHSITNPLIEEICEYSNVDNLQTVYNKIYIGDLLNFVNLNDILPMLTKLKSKLVHEGIICIEEFDLFELSNALVRGKLHSPDMNNVLRPRQQLLTVHDILDVSNRTGLRVISKDIDNYKHYIELQNV